MKYFVIFYIDCKTMKNVNLKGQYATQEDASNDLLPSALEYVRLEQGKQQADIALQNVKTVNELLIDESFREGLYIKQEETIISIYSKVKEVIPGTIWNSAQMKINRIGIFGVTEIELNISVPIAPVFSTAPRKRANSIPKICYLDELRKVLSNSDNFGLKKTVKVPVEIEMEELTDDYDYSYNYDN